MASTEIDLNQIAIGVSSHIYDDAKSYFSRAFVDAINSIKVKFKSEFRAYISNSLAKTAYVKTILHSDQSVPLGSLYIPLTFTASRRRRSDKYIIEQIRNGGKVLIRGTAGGGKSMLIKNIHVSMLKDFDGLIPVFYELRALNKKNGASLVECLYESVKEFVPVLSRSAFEDGLRKNKFALVLDGFDEIDYDIRDSYAAEIDALCDSSPALSVAITTRPEDNLTGLRAFTVYEAEAMSLAQCVRLLKKIDYDRERKLAFIEEVQSSL